MILAPVSPPPAQPARGEGKVAGGRGQTVRDGGQSVRGLPRVRVQAGEAQTHCYAFSARLDAESYGYS